MDYQNDPRLAELHQELLTLMSAFKEICDREGFVYFLGCGTLLGAVRHKGFIPWDDDADVLMPREEFDRFRAYVEAHPELPFNLRTYDNSDNEVKILAQPKIQSNTKYILRTFGNVTVPQPVFFDIFMLYGMPNNKFRRNIRFYRSWFLKRVYRLAVIGSTGVGEDKGTVKKTIARLLQTKLCRKLFSMKKVLAAQDRYLKKIPYGSTDWIYANITEYKKKAIGKLEWFGKGKAAPFEDTEFMIPDDSDALLTTIFGDYMTPPPPEKRVYKHCSEIITK